MKDIKKPTLSYLEIPIVKHCNLKCKYCSHLANIENEWFEDYDFFEKNLVRLSSLFENIETIRLLGGEPLLHPKAVSFSTLVRKYFPSSEIKIVTNGLLIPKMEDSELKILKEYGVIFDITLYPPTCAIKDKIIEKLKKSGVVFYISDEIKEFQRRLLPFPTSDFQKAWQTCNSNKCYILCGGEMSYCCVPQLQGAAEKYFNMNMDFSDSKINIFDDLSGQDIIDFLNVPHTCCAFCGIPQKVAWEISKEPEISDWSVTEAIK